MSWIAAAVAWAAFKISWLDWATASPACTTCAVVILTSPNTRLDCSTLVVNPLTSPPRFCISASTADTTVWIWSVRCWRETSPSLVCWARLLTWEAIASNSRATTKNWRGSRCSEARAATSVAFKASTCVREAIWLWSCTNWSAKPTNSPSAFICCTIRFVPPCNTSIPWVMVLIASCPCSTTERTSNKDLLARSIARVELWADCSTCSVSFCTCVTSCACSWALVATVWASFPKAVEPVDIDCAVDSTWERTWPNCSSKRLKVSATNPVVLSLTSARVVKSPSSTVETTCSNCPTSCCRISPSNARDMRLATELTKLISPACHCRVSPMCSQQITPAILPALRIGAFNMELIPKGMK